MRESTILKHSINCSQCGTLIDERSCYYTHGGKALCDTCFATGYELCNGCSYIYALSEMVIAENEVEIYCSRCNGERQLADNNSICVSCGVKTDDDKGETKWDEHGDPHCKACYSQVGR